MKLESKSLSVTVLIITGALMFSSSNAADLQGGGTVAYIPLATETSTLPDGSTLERGHTKGVIFADDPAISFHLASQDCRGTTIISPDGQNVVVSGSCDAVDKDGDVWWLWYIGTPQGTEWGVIGGTGKYQGMTGGGTTQSQGLSHGDRLVINWQGTWSLK